MSATVQNCFVCTGEIRRTRNSNNCNPNSDNSNSDEKFFLLCQILDIPHLGQNMQKMDGIKYCSNCLRRIFSIRDMLEELEKLEKQILDEIYSLEVQFKETSNDHGRNNRTSSVSLGTSDKLRSQIISELRSTTVQSMLDKVRLRCRKQISRKPPLPTRRSSQIVEIPRIESSRTGTEPRNAIHETICNETDDSDLLELDLPGSVHIKCENLTSDPSENSNEIPGTSNNEIETFLVDCSEESDSESEPEHPLEKKTRVSKDWDFVQNFSSKSEAEEYIKSQNLWSRDTTKSTTDGVKEYFHCRYNRKCRPSIHLLYPIEDNSVVKLYECTDRDHAPHETKRKKSHAIPDAQKEIIQKLFSDGIRKPKPILRAMKEQGYGEVRRIQLCNYLAYLRKQMIGKNSSSNSNEVVETVQVRIDGINQNWMENITSWCEGTSFNTTTTTSVN